ncbi:hypothetical protein JAO76_07900 [Pontibacter sp. BT310]|uniref:Uncharacterized protein n=1 Tax=Pontibacter populi TaxID=890055 RepID=A0ABS6XAR1_9BACT|nr:MULTISPECIES: hypothetical protein [Pontibacter]MBJ6118108.1 hypothetical protein [Pontibacter sp. BT310]MBR0570535.1 hypothetical protein [Microvirga sp. STS03]MBW3364961.1 hypothetical protein [Pontibacter populi]
MNQELWYFLISGDADEESGMYGNFYAYGEHLGDALQNTFIAAMLEDFSNANVVEASLLDSFEVIEDKDELLQLSDSVYMRNTTYTYPLNDLDREFIPPIGIVKATGEDEYDYDLISEQFVAYGQDENGIFELELVVGKEKLTQTFLKALDFLPVVDGFWMYMQDHWENGEMELWYALHLTEKEQIVDLLMNQKVNTIKNGYVKLVVHSSTEETNLTLDDHKKIQLHTKSEDVFQSFIEQVTSLGYEQTREFYNLEFGFHHWHYRPANSLTREGLISFLQATGFEKVNI